MNTVKFQLETLTCPSCIKKIEGKLRKTAGVKEAKVMFNSSKVKVVFDKNQVDAHELEKIITKLGYPVLSTKAA